MGALESLKPLLCLGRLLNTQAFFVIECDAAEVAEAAFFGNFWNSLICSYLLNELRDYVHTYRKAAAGNGASFESEFACLRLVDLL